MNNVERITPTNGAKHPGRTNIDGIMGLVKAPIVQAIVHNGFVFIIKAHKAFD